MYNNLSRFDFNIEFIPGKDNHIADALSQLWEVQGLPVKELDFVHERDLDLLFLDSIPAPVDAGVAALATRFDQSDDDNNDDVEFHKAEEFLDFEESAQDGIWECLQASLTPLGALDQEMDNLDQEVDPDHNPLDLLGPLQPKNPTQAAVSPHQSPLHVSMPSFFMSALPPAYKADPRFVEVLAHPSSWPMFEVDDDGLVYCNDGEHWVLCIPRGRVLDDSSFKSKTRPTLREFLIHTTHKVVAHANEKITLSHLRHFFWWDHMTKDTSDFCRSCEPCARGKTSTQAPFGLL